MTTERSSGSELAAPSIPGLDAAQQLRVLSCLAAHIELPALVGAIPEALADIVRVDGARYRPPAGAEDIRTGRRTRHSIEYRLLPSPDEPLGLLTLYRSTAFKEQELARVEAALPLLMLSLRNALAYRTAIASALTDPLTSIGNRAALASNGRAQVELAHRHSLPMSLLLVDIDFFKRINDSYGHARGDAVLRSLARTIARTIRRSDHVFRYGGEEFVVMLAHTDAGGAHTMAERIRILVAANRELTREIPEGVTVSIGVGTLRADDTLESLCERADSALYRAKRAGRNRVAAPEVEGTAAQPEAAPAEATAKTASAMSAGDYVV